MVAERCNGDIWAVVVVWFAWRRAVGRCLGYVSDFCLFLASEGQIGTTTSVM